MPVPGAETNVIKKPWDSTPVRMALAFPDLYEIGMSHLGMSVLYTILNDLPFALVETGVCARGRILNSFCGNAMMNWRRWNRTGR